MAQTNASGTRNTAGIGTAMADATANPTTTGAASYGMVWNGTTWDRVKGASTASSASPTGVQAVSLVGYDATATTWRPVYMDGASGLLTTNNRSAITSFSLAANELGASIDTTFFASICVAIRIMNSFCVQFEGSLNNSDWFPVTMWHGGSTTLVSTTPQYTGNTHGYRAWQTGLYYGPATAKYFRINNNPGGQSGTVNGHYQLSAAAMPPPPTSGSLRCGNGRATVNATSNNLPENSCRSVTVKAARANTNPIYIGLSAPGTGGTAVAASSGFELWAGETLSVDVANTTQIRYIGTSGDAFTYVWIG